MYTTNSLCRVNAVVLKEKVKEQELKYYWVAEQLGVHKTTLRRWLSGQIKRTHVSKVELLAKVLQVDSSNLKHTD